MLYNRLLELNYSIIFLTGRKEPFRNATILNLKRENLGTYARLILRSPDQYGMTAQEFKSKERAKLVQEVPPPFSLVIVPFYQNLNTVHHFTHHYHQQPDCD